MGLRNRLCARSKLVTGKFVHSSEHMRLVLNPGRGKGGTCFGDSGGPDLLGGTDTVLIVNSCVTNYNCAGVAYSSRVDIPEPSSGIRPSRSNGELPCMRKTLPRGNASGLSKV
jgi:hypothetical protein